MLTTICDCRCTDCWENVEDCVCPDMLAGAVDRSTCDFHRQVD